ncbi:hypothetical protein ACFV0T_18865 [Streptomyces sp. NPDC059582]|uniref:hypothetical protein n=1 Tax=Streptomyces sp. NPDC059582 TaxID=3346875 RepID=UPI0036B26293
MSSEYPTLGKEVMATSITDIQTDHSSSADFLPGPGTGRHRGLRAEDDRCPVGSETAEEHGRHRGTALSSLIQPAEDLPSRSDELAQPHARDEGTGSAWQRCIAVELVPVETFPRYEETPNAWSAQGQKPPEPIAEDAGSDHFTVDGQARAA